MRRSVLLLPLIALTAGACEPAREGGVAHDYYIAADEVAWDYAPSGLNQITGEPFDKLAKFFVESGPTQIGRVYRKAIYREYTDETFTTRKPRSPEWEHLGILGPLLRAEVGDTIRVVFRNHTSFPSSVHPHGVFYHKDSEGAPYDDGTSGAAKADDAVPPGGTHTYTWPVPERAGPGTADLTSVVWPYHSHTNATKDVNAGLIGPIIVSARGTTQPDGTLKDVDREFITLFMIFDEQRSRYLDHNIETYTGDPASVDKREESSGFRISNFMDTVNGLVFGNLPMMTMQQGERVRWYLITLGGEFDFHTPHWHGQTVLVDNKRTDVVSLLPAVTLVADMLPDNPGIWMFHCHVNEHRFAGMSALFTVMP